MTKKGSININGIDDELIKQTTLTYLAAIFLVLVGYVFVWPRFADLMRIKANIKTAQDKSKEYQTSLGQLDNFKKVFTDYDRDLLYEAIPLSFDPGLILINIRNISQKLGVGIIEYDLSGGLVEKPKDEKAEKSNTAATEKSKKVQSNMGENTIELKVSGSTQALMDFMKSIEESTPLARISEVSVSTVSQIISGNYPLETVTLTMTIDYYNYPMVSVLGQDISKSLISEADLKVIEEIKTYRRVQKGSGTFGGVTIPGGNKNLFDE